MVEDDEGDNDPTGILISSQLERVSATGDFLAKGVQWVYTLEFPQKVCVYSRTQMRSVRATVHTISEDGKWVEVRYPNRSRTSISSKVVGNEETTPAIYLNIKPSKVQGPLPSKPPEMLPPKPQEPEEQVGGLRGFFRRLWSLRLGK